MNNKTNDKITFSQKIKEEISEEISSARHCRIAELAAFLSFGGQIIRSNNAKYIKFQTENIAIARKYFTLIKKTFNINVEISISTQKKAKVNTNYFLLLMMTGIL